MIVKNIKFNGDKVEVVLDCKSFYLSKENYIENPLAIESEISEEKISYLLNYEKIIESKMEMIKLLNRKALSEYEVAIKLKGKEIDHRYIKQIIDSLKRMGLINNEFVAIVTCENMLIKRSGKNKIRKHLKEKKIDESTIEKVLKDIDEELYLRNFNKCLEKYLKMYEKKSHKLKENMIRQKLVEIGYEEELISSIYIDDDRDNEVEVAKQALLKLIKNKNTDLNNYENINKIKTKLIMKGFSYDIINIALEEVKHNETY